MLCVRGHFQELLYDEDSNLEEVIDMVPGGVIVNVLIGKRHNLRSLESGTVQLETKMGRTGRWKRMRCFQVKSEE